ncbi:uncharacterized protein B0T15DRAFT_530761 [Chaetomium strumarium]|uniref:FAD-binding domain-containing protein n=1 Tax=Chaetomium strumarium TaxID=1170767 RepID=A0AAJ0M3I3_9PEZI|nr:hypothetical protein B0T15DRAFT_530761 [Chaetomium strumarium]
MMSTHYFSGRHIVIAGGGMAGLSFAIALRKLWPGSLLPAPRVTVFERDTKLDAAGREGYSLSLAGFDSTGGLVALKDLGLLDEILGHALTGLGETGAFKIWDADWSEVMSVRLRPAEGLPTSLIRIKRKDLRQTLLRAVGEDTVHWGVACLAATKLEDGKVTVQLSGHAQPSIECDLLIVADGANSKIRASLRPDDGLEYAGAVQMGGIARFPAGVPPPLNNNWGMQLSGGQGVGCFYAQVDDTSAVWGLSFLEKEPRQRLTFSTFHSQEAIRAVQEEGRRRGHMLGPLFHTMVDATTDHAIVFPARDKKPFGHTMDLPVVFIGDANHAVSPFAGYGASLALKDGWDLAQQLVTAGSVEEAVRRYDAISVPRANKALSTSRFRIKWFHCTGWTFFFARALLVVGGLMLRLMGRD